MKILLLTSANLSFLKYIDIDYNNGHVSIKIRSNNRTLNYLNLNIAYP